MTDTPLLTLTDRAMARLRMLGEGNGLSPDDFQLIEKNEEVFIINGIIHLTPSFDIQAQAYVGKIKGKNRKVLPNFAALQEEVNRRKKEFQESSEWMQEAIKELKEEPGHGWGLNEGKITFPGKNITLAATEKCPNCGASGKILCDMCQGRTVILCKFCHGQRQEVCYNCFGKGTEPNNPDLQCHICRGTRFAMCRNCKGTGNVVCPNCQGYGGTPCPACQGAGWLTQEVNIVANAEIKFSIQKGTNLPSGLLRSLDRLGMANLGKGHGDIEFIVPEENDQELPRNSIILRARVPYADIKLRIKNKAIIASSFGKHGLLSGLPAFLDESLKPWRDALAKAANGTASLDKAIEARAIREALALKLRGKGNDLRRLYPIGLSPKVAQEILENTEKSLRRITQQARSITAFISLILSAGVFAAYYLTSLRTEFVKQITHGFALAIDVLLPVSMAGLSGIAFVHAAKWVLKRRYPKYDIHLSQSMGKTGYATLAGILLVYALMYALAKYRLVF